MIRSGRGGEYADVFAAFDGPQLAFHEVHWDGAACTIRFTMTGRHVGEFMGVPATGTAIALAGMTLLHFAGNRVVERFSQADMLGLLVQLGAVPAPAEAWRRRPSPGRGLGRLRSGDSSGSRHRGLRR